jgi:hypothetical protein
MWPSGAPSPLRRWHLVLTPLLREAPGKHGVNGLTTSERFQDLQMNE